MSVDEAELALKKARLEAKSAETQRDAEVKVVRERWAPEIERTSAELRAAILNLGKAKEAACAHPWLGKVVRRMDRKKTSGSIYRPEYSTIEVRGVVEICGPSNPWGGRKYSAPDHGTPVVRILTKGGKPGAKHEELTRFTIGGRVTDWSLVETDPA